MKKEKTIWVITRNFYPLWAGPSERFFRYAKISKNTGLEIQFKTLHREGGFEGDEFEGVKVERYHVNNQPKLNQIISDNISNSNGKKPDACIFLGLSKDLVKVNKQLQKAGVKSIFVSTMELDVHNRTNGKKRGPIRKFLFKKYMHWLMDSFDFIVASSNYLGQKFIDLNISPHKLKTIPNGVDIHKFSPINDTSEIQSIREKLGIPNGFIFLFVGLLIERKGILELFEGWKKYKSDGGKGHLLLVGNEKRAGESSHEFYEKLDTAKEPLQKKYDAIFHPASRQIDQYFKASDAFVFMSKLEGMPNVILESMSSGLPILLHKFKGFSDDYGKEKTHYFSTTLSSDEIAEKLKYLYENGEHRAKVSHHARKLIEENFQVSQSIASYKNLA